MARKIIKNIWDRENRNNINSNFEELYYGVNDISGKITDEIYAEIREDVTLNWKEPVDTEADLPTDAKNGDTRMVRDTGKIYRYNGDSWVEVKDVDSTAYTEMEDRLLTKIGQKETPQGAQSKADEAEQTALNAVSNLEKQVYSDSDSVIKLVEKGSNANGHFMRWSDGKMECWGMNIAQTTEVSAGNIFRSESGTITFPKEFDGTFPVHVSCFCTAIGRWANPSSVRSTDATVYQYNTINSSGNFSVYAHALGRWK